MDKLVALPAFDFASPPSESDFLLLPVERFDDFLASLGPPESRSLRLNLWLPSLDTTDGARGRGAGEAGMRGVGGADDCPFLGVALAAGGATLPPETPPDMLGALLGALLGAWLGGLVEGALQLSLSEGEGDSMTDGGPDPNVDVERCFSRGGSTSISFSSAERVCPGSLGYAPASGEGSGMLLLSVSIVSPLPESFALIVSSARPWDAAL